MASELNMSPMARRHRGETSMSGGGGYLGGGGSMAQRHRGETYKGKGKDDCDDFLWPVRGMMYRRKAFLDMAEDEGSIPCKASRSTKYWRGKPENQNHSIIFTRGEALQTIDMNQLDLCPIKKPGLAPLARGFWLIQSGQGFAWGQQWSPSVGPAQGVGSGRDSDYPISRKDATSTSKSTMEKMPKKRGGQVGGGSDKGLGRDL
uniref:ATGSL04 (glucan synthase-like 4) n=1 Tax=Solanum tuberosum TaxID=4113 RepID=M0ZJE8_SOLTU